MHEQAVDGSYAMIPMMAMPACPDLAVPAALMAHVAQVESNMNPFAIGVVGGRLVRQPESLDEAIATARMLEAKGYNYSVGLAQVNRSNFHKYGLDTYATAFSPCANLLAGSRILAQCYANAHGAWGQAFSCYYSGDFTTGFRDGYVQKIMASLDRDRTLATASPESVGAIALVATSAAKPARTVTSIALPPPGTSAYRLAIRSSAVDALAGVLLTPAVRTVAVPQSSSNGATTLATQAVPAMPAAPTGAMATASASTDSAQKNSVFEPQVTGPGDAQQPQPTSSATASARSNTATAVPAIDEAFVF